MGTPPSTPQKISKIAANQKTFFSRVVLLKRSPIEAEKKDGREDYTREIVKPCAY